MVPSLADVAEVEADEFKSSVIAAAPVSYHFVWRRVLRTANEYPRSLACGDIEESLIELSNSDRPLETMASQCWLLLQVGFNVRHLVGTVQHHHGCIGTSTIADQLHGSLAALKRAYSQYHEDTLMARAQVLTIRLLPKPTEDGKLLARVTKEEAQLAQNKPDGINGRQA